MEIALINPKSEATRGSSLLKRLISIYRVTFPVLAAYTPEGVNITTYDENVESIDFNRPIDLVGITVLTSAYQRACEVTEKYQSLGVPVVWGGIHPTVRPEESKSFADSIVKGNGELAIQRVLHDLNDGHLLPEYSEPFPDKRHNPDRRVLNGKSLISFDTVETSRGCPNLCDYCSVSVIQGKTVTTFSIDSVIEDIQSTKGKNIFFVDDNLIANQKYAKALFERMEGIGKNWLSQAPVYIAENEELLRLASESGCIGLYLGLESITQSSLIEANKKRNRVNRYSDLIKKIHDYGIGVEAGFMFGFDNDDESVFDKTLEFIDQANIDSPNFHILTPYPGTPRFERLKRENRVLHEDWSKYTTGNVVFRPEKMTEDVLQEGYNGIWRESHSWNRIIRRTLGSNHLFYTFVVNVADKGRAHYK